MAIMIFLGIFDDFCNWWIFWWIMPFLLGLLLGAILWRHYKAKFNDMERQIREQKSAIENYEYQQRKLKSEYDSKMHDFERLKSRNVDLERDLAMTKSNLAKLSKPSEKSVVEGHKEKEEKVKAKEKSKEKEKEKAKGKEKTKEKTKDKSSATNLGSKIKDNNLQIIEGIGPRMEAILKENEINTHKELASKSDGELRALLDKYGGRYSIVDPTSWPEQAKLAAKQRWDALIKFQSSDGSDSKVRKLLDKLK